LNKALTPVEAELPEASVELGEFEKGTNKSTRFTLRTTETSTHKVQDAINRALGDNLPKVQLQEPKIEATERKTTRAILDFVDPKTGQPDYASVSQVGSLLTSALEQQGLSRSQRRYRLVRAPGALENEGLFSKMELEMMEEVDPKKLEAALGEVRAAFAKEAQPLERDNFDSELAADIRQRAMVAILTSWGAILLYLWFRFGSWTFGLAAVFCLIHDLFFTLGIIAGCHYIYGTFFGNALQIQDFKIDFAAVAALLTLVGYSVNDTIVVFDRLREVRGKNPLLTPQMINDSVNQTLSRTILASLTTWLVVIVLYIWGGEGVHLFAFVMVVGVIIGTYSSIYVASPLLLMFGEGQPAKPREPQRQVQTAGTRE
jgi:SecD/SecF fusion protein